MDRRRSAAELAGGGAPPVDMCAEIVVAVGRRCADGHARADEILVGDTAWRADEAGSRVLLRVGGVWDPGAEGPGGTRGAWADREASTCLRLRIHAGQEAVARRFVAWLPLYVAGHSSAAPLYDLLLRGGRRGGKTFLAAIFTILFCVVKSRRIVHAISAINDTTIELIDLFESLVPAEWYGGKLQRRKNTPPEMVFANGSRIRFLSGHAYRKQGRVDLAFFNEMQDGIPQESYEKARGAIADTGGMVLSAFNPAIKIESAWVDDFFDRAERGEVTGGAAYAMVARDNPLVDHDALDAMESGTMDPRAYRREVLGERVAFGDAVMHEWTEAEHWIDPPPGWPDVTAQFLVDRGLPAASGIVGMDFQVMPYMSGRVLRVYRSPTGMLCPWVVGEADPEGDEETLHHALVDLGADPATWPAVIDGSGTYQAAVRVHDGRSSERVLRRLGWRTILTPVPGSVKNPEVLTRMRNANRLLRSVAGDTMIVRLRVARSCPRTAEQFAKYELVNGKPSRRSRHAHGVDAVTYPLFRFFPPAEGGGGRLYRGARQDGQTPSSPLVSGRELDRREDREARRPRGRSFRGVF